MDLIFDLELAVPGRLALPEQPVPAVHSEAISLGRWYDQGYNASDVDRDVIESLTCSTAELLAYWLGGQDAAARRPRRDIS